MEPKNKKISLNIFMPVFILFLIGIFFTVLIVFLEDKNNRNNLLLQAHLVEKAVNWQKYTDLTGSENDQDLPSYKRLKEQLMVIRSANPKCRFIYFLGQRPDKKVFFYVDSEPSDSLDCSPPGQIFSEVSEKIVNIFSTAKSSVEGPESDRWGTWVSALVPVVDPASGKVIALLGMDIDARDWIKTIFIRSLLPLNFFISICLLLGLVLYIQHRNRQERLRSAQAQLQLENSENKYRSLFINFQDAMCTLKSPAWRFSVGNPAMLRLFGIENEEQVLTLGLADLSPEYQPDGALSAQKMQENIETVLREGALSFEWQCQRLNGEEFPANVFITRISLPGEVLLQVVIRDISDYKKAAEENRRHMKELEVFYKISMGREERIIELKAEVERLKKERDL